MERLLKLAVCLWGVLSVMSGCGGGDKVDPDDPDSPGFVVKFEVGETVYGESSDGGSKQIRLTSNTKWRVTGMTDWCSVVPESGDGDVEVKITVKPNPDYEERKVVLTFKAGETTKEVTVTQKKKDALIVTGTEYLIEAGGEKIEVELKSNLEYEVIIAPEYAEWIKQVMQPRSLVTDQLVFEILPNKGYDDRLGKIVFKDKNSMLSDTVHITQSKVHALILLQEEYVVESQAGTLEVELQRNIAYDVIIPECMKSWISQVASRALETDKLIFNVRPNTGKENRSGAIIVKESNGAAIELLTVVQLKEAAIVTSAVEQIVPVGGANLNIDVREGGHYDVTIPQAYKSWIRLESPMGRSMSTEQLKFNILPNDTRENREGRILVASGGTVDTVKVFQPITQEVSKTVVLSPLNYHVGLRDTTIRLRLRGDADYEFRMPADAGDWVINQSGEISGRRNIDLMIRANETSKDREVQITVWNKLFDTEETITIIQEGEKLDLTPEQLSDFSAKGGIQRLYVSTNLDRWDVALTANETWCRLEKEKDAIKVEVKENESIESRVTEIEVTAGKITRRLPIKQVGATPYIEVDGGNSMNVGVQGGELTTAVVTNAGVLSLSMDAGSEWCHVVLTEGILRVTVDANMATEERVAVILLKAGTVTERVNVTQNGAKAYLELNTDVVKFGKAASSENVYIYTNEKVWSASMNEVVWCTLSEADSLLTVSVSENTLGESRSVTITIRAGELSRNVVVTQGAHNEVEIYPEVEDSWVNDEVQMEASNVKYTIEFEVNENIENPMDAVVMIGMSKYIINGLEVTSRVENGKKVYMTELYVRSSLTGRMRLQELRFMMNQQYVRYSCDFPLLTGEKNKVLLSKMN